MWILLPCTNSSLVCFDLFPHQRSSTNSSKFQRSKFQLLSNLHELSPHHVITSCRLCNQQTIMGLADPWPRQWTICRIVKCTHCKFTPVQPRPTSAKLSRRGKEKQRTYSSSTWDCSGCPVHSLEILNFCCLGGSFCTIFVVLMAFVPCLKLVCL